MEIYERDFESKMLQDSVAYYSNKASSWIDDDSYAIYLLKPSLYTKGFFPYLVYIYIYITFVFNFLGRGLLEKGEESKCCKFPKYSYGFFLFFFLKL
jgi:hypothetical protein